MRSQLRFLRFFRRYIERARGSRHLTLTERRRVWRHPCWCPSRTNQLAVWRPWTLWPLKLVAIDVKERTIWFVKIVGKFLWNLFSLAEIGEIFARIFAASVGKCGSCIRWLRRVQRISLDSWSFTPCCIICISGCNTLFFLGYRCHVLDTIMSVFPDNRRRSLGTWWVFLSSAQSCCWGCLGSLQYIHRDNVQ